MGSSRRRTSGLTKSARASAMRIRQPPLNDLVGRFCISASKERPDRIIAARASAPDASICSSLRVWGWGMRVRLG